MPTFQCLTVKFGPAPLATVAAAMEAHVERLPTSVTLHNYQIVECHRDNQVIGIIVHDLVLLPDALASAVTVNVPAVAHVP